MFNVKCVYLKILDVMWDFWFSKVIHLYYILSTFCKLHLAEYRNDSTQFSRSTNVTPITTLYNTLTVMTLGILSCRKGACGLKPAEVCCSL